MKLMLFLVISSVILIHYLGIYSADNIAYDLEIGISEIKSIEKEIKALSKQLNTEFSFEGIGRELESLRPNEYEMNRFRKRISPTAIRKDAKEVLRELRENIHNQ